MIKGCMPCLSLFSFFFFSERTQLVPLSHSISRPVSNRTIHVSLPAAPRPPQTQWKAACSKKNMSLVKLVKGTGFQKGSSWISVGVAGAEGRWCCRLVLVGWLGGEAGVRAVLACVLGGAGSLCCLSVRGGDVKISNIHRLYSLYTLYI